jgi:hypothetical protein
VIALPRAEPIQLYAVLPPVLASTWVGRVGQVVMLLGLKKTENRGIFNGRLKLMGKAE